MFLNSLQFHHNVTSDWPCQHSNDLALTFGECLICKLESIDTISFSSKNTLVSKGNEMFTKASTALLLGEDSPAIAEKRVSNIAMQILYKTILFL